MEAQCDAIRHTYRDEVWVPRLTTVRPECQCWGIGFLLYVDVNPMAGGRRRSRAGR